jgi:hypothetical protein
MQVPQVTKTDAKPSAKQVYGIARAALQLLELDWPADRQSASQLYARLLEHNRAGAVSAEGMAF